LSNLIKAAKPKSRKALLNFSRKIAGRGAEPHKAQSKHPTKQEPHLAPAETPVRCAQESGLHPNQVRANKGATVQRSVPCFCRRQKRAAGVCRNLVLGFSHMSYLCSNGWLLRLVRPPARPFKLARLFLRFGTLRLRPLWKMVVDWEKGSLLPLSLHLCFYA